MYENAERLLKEIIHHAPETEDGDEDVIRKAKHLEAKAMLALARLTFEKFANNVRDMKIRFEDQEYEFLTTDISFHLQEALLNIRGLNLNPHKQSIYYFYYGQYLEYCAKVESEHTGQRSRLIVGLQKALEYYQRAFDLISRTHSISHKIGTICRLMWSMEDNHEYRLKSVMKQEKQWIENNTRRHYMGRVIIPPTQLVSTNVIPPPFKMVSFRQLLNDYNFETQDVNNPHLIKSLNIYETANEVAEHKCRLYLVLLARICQSFGKDNTALEYFSEAREIEDKVISISIYRYIDDWQFRGVTYTYKVTW